MITTHYFGSGCPEMAMRFLLPAAKEKHGVDLSHPPCFYSASDIDKGCQTVLLSHLDEESHVFGDQLARLKWRPQCSRVSGLVFFDLNCLLQ